MALTDNAKVPAPNPDAQLLKMYNFIGLAMKAGKLAVGENKSEDSLRSGKAASAAPFKRRFGKFGQKVHKYLRRQKRSHTYSKARQRRTGARSRKARSRGRGGPRYRVRRAYP